MVAAQNSPFAPSAPILDFSVRLIFFAAAPVGIVALAAIFPVTGALCMIALALFVFIFGEAVRALSFRYRVLGKLLKGQLAFESYYRETPPKPFLYYVFYPFLFPYWLSVRQARREFFLYKGYTLVSIGVLIFVSIWQFFTLWKPELGWRDFLLVFALQLVVETLLVLMLVMPIVTSVVRYHTEGSTIRLAVLLLAALLSSAVALQRLEHRRDPIVSFATRERVGMRTSAKPRAAHDAQLAGLRAAWRVLPHEQSDVEKDGKVQGDALEAAHKALKNYYKEDEALAFDAWFTKNKKQEILVLYFEARRNKLPIFLALDHAGHEIRDSRALPKGALSAMKHAADGVID